MSCGDRLTINNDLLWYARLTLAESQGGCYQYAAHENDHKA